MSQSSLPLQRGDLVLVNLDPAVGSEANKTRPAVVVSNDHANLTSPVVTVIPITSNTARVYSFQVYLPQEESGLDHDSKAQAEQMRSLDRRRVRGSLGQLPAEAMRRLDAALRLHLTLT
ncbi:type II toxin-antitoxin system PemK/MazF family toxin [Deinococcus sp. MIMF12]|uniref:mRNA interferase n=1 Tax=Deinococcus rhizophilus TaxID=3049544 RepID=A0ABT7JCF5_9DEIO|nr:type II toxin-antitoxin system PemK/MazF family toxin [Deinococcus rhizophilus]MDL2342714.1 type II toxin-antitoxin system PemK/MazF family toxin [Deinococcus rhizophilus]